MDSNIKIIPIFKQTDKTWADFARITHHFNKSEKFNILFNVIAGTYKYNEEKILSFAAYDDNKMVGYSSAWVNERPGVGYLSSLYIEPEYQGKNIGTALLNRTESAVGIHNKRIELYPLESSYDFYKNHNGYELHNDYMLGKNINFPKSGIIPVFTFSNIISNSCFNIIQSIFKVQKNQTAAKMCDDIKVSITCENEPMFVYILSGQIVGFLHGAIFEKTETGRIRHLFVRKDCQKKFGIGASLVNEFLSFAEQSGIRQIILTQPMRATNSVDFYRKQGFALKHGTANYMEKFL